MYNELLSLAINQIKIKNPSFIQTDRQMNGERTQNVFGLKPP